MGVALIVRINEAQSDIDAAAQAAADTKNAPYAAAATSNAPASSATSDLLFAVDTFDAISEENSRLHCRFDYSMKILMADKELFWYHNENIPPNVIGMFENDLIYGRVFYVPRPNKNMFDFSIKWDMSRLPDLFPIAQCPLCSSIANTHAQKLHLHLDIDRANTDKYNFTYTRAQGVQRQVQSASPIPHRSLRTQTTLRQSLGVPLIAGM